MVDLTRTPGGAITGRDWKIRECFRRIKQALLKAGVKVPQYLPEMLSILTMRFIGTQFQEIIPNLKCLEVKCYARLEEIERCQERFLACKRKLVLEQNNAQAKTAKLRKYFDASAALIRYLKIELAHREAAQAEGAQAETRRLAADQSICIDAFQREMTVLRCLYY